MVVNQHLSTIRRFLRVQDTPHALLRGAEVKRAGYFRTNALISYTLDVTKCTPTLLSRTGVISCMSREIATTLRSDTASALSVTMGHGPSAVIDPRSTSPCRSILTVRSDLSLLVRSAAQSLELEAGCPTPWRWFWLRSRFWRGESAPPRRNGMERSSWRPRPRPSEGLRHRTAW